jgi:glucokinase
VISRKPGKTVILFTLRERLSMTKACGETLALAGDIGGTKTSLGVYAKGKRRPSLKVAETYSSRDASGLGDIIGQFLEKTGVSVHRACFGVAGPIQRGRVKTTNLPWEVSEVGIKRRFGWSQVRLVNDLAATALGIPLLGSRELCLLNDKRPSKGQNMGLLAPGTGLGMALLVWSGDRYIPLSSEGGHMDFGPNTPAEMDLWQYLRRRFGHVSMERALSGPGLFNIYGWLKHSGRYKEPAWLSRKIGEHDPPMVITEAALDRKIPLAVAALKMFVGIFGAVAGNLALAGMTTGGMYLGGGIPPKILPRLKDYGFLETFENKGRFREFMHKIPVRVVLNDKAALLGAAQCALSGYL